MGGIAARAGVAVLAAWSALLVVPAALASLDGAGLFVLPADRLIAASVDPPRAAPRRWRLVTEVRALGPTIERLRRFAVMPAVFGRGGIGVRISGKM